MEKFSERLLKDYGEPVHEHTVVNGKGFYTIKHAFKIGGNMRFLNIKESYNPYNSWEKFDAVNKAKERYNRYYYHIKS